MRAKRSLLAAVLWVGCLTTATHAQQPVRWQPTLQMGKQVAAQTNRLVLVHFWAPSCSACMKMEREVFSRAEVAAALEADYVAVKLNADYFPTTARQYGVTALPTDVIMTPQGQVIERIVGFKQPSDYTTAISWIANNVRGGAWRPYAQIPAGAPQAVADAAGAAQGSGGFAQGMAGGIGPPPGMANSPYAAPAAGDPGFSQNPGAAAVPYLPPYGGAFSAGPSAPATPAAPQQPAAAGPGVSNNPWTLGGQGNIPIPSSAPAGGQNPLQPGTQMGGQPLGQPGSFAQGGTPPAAGANPPLALDGFCAVSLSEKAKWVPGDRRWGIIHQGRTYLFAGPDEKDRFWRNPDLYAPVLAGHDLVLMVEQGQLAPGQRRHGAWYGDRVYLFSSEASYEKFRQGAERYVNALLQATRVPPAPGYRY